MLKKLSMVLIILMLVACGKPNVKTSKVIFALDTVINIENEGVNSEQATEDINKYIIALEGKLSRTLTNSQVAILNQNSILNNPDSDIVKLIQKAQYYNEFTHGAFDITIAPIADLWGFTKGIHQIPAQESIQDQLPYVGMDHIQLNTNQITLDANTAIDLGGIAKGLAAQDIATIYHNQRIKSGYANLGGDLLVYGLNKDLKPWKVGIQNPDLEAQEKAIGYVELNDAYVFTSGNYQRYFIEDGVRYHHIIDPSTGYPSNNELVSVTIIADAKDDNGIMCDALSTALFVLGKDEAIKLWQANQTMFGMILITNTNEVIISNNISDKFNLIDEHYHVTNLN